jgi:hypothetical protein
VGRVAACVLGWWERWYTVIWLAVTRGAGQPPVGAAGLGGLEAARDGARVCRGARGAVVGARCAVPGVVFVPCRSGLRLALLFRLRQWALAAGSDSQPVGVGDVRRRHGQARQQGLARDV